MKKKGLIVATIVMVLVLAVSLTTATYAWFTQTSSSSIENIEVSVSSGSNIAIGLTKTGTYASNAIDTSFVSGSLTWAAETQWGGTSNTEGMSGTVDTNLTLDGITQAVSTATAATSSGVPDAANLQLTNSTFIKANGNADGTVIADSIEAAVENADYLHFTLGMLPTISTVDYYTLNITVASTDAKSIMGMMAGLHVMFRVNNETKVVSETTVPAWHNIDLGGNKNYSTKKALSSDLRTLSDTYGEGSTASLKYAVTLNAYNSDSTLETITGNGATTSTAIKAGSSNIAIRFNPKATSEANTTVHGTDAGDINQVEIYIYYVGSDSDCRKEALIGSSAVVYFTIVDHQAN